MGGEYLPKQQRADVHRVFMSPVHLSWFPVRHHETQLKLKPKPVRTSQNQDQNLDQNLDQGQDQDLDLDQDSFLLLIC